MASTARFEWRVVRRLATGSLPATALTLVALSWLHMNTGGARHLITSALSVALLLTAVVLIGRNTISAVYARRLSNLSDRVIARTAIVIGAVLGVIVTLSSIGAGAIGATVLALLYPRTAAVRIVGSDIAHAVPLALIAALGHGAMGSLDLHALVSLLAGSLPGIFAGSSVSPRVPDLGLRYILAAVLITVGTKLMLDNYSTARPNIIAVTAPGAP